jgi:predicted DNA-binding transcriptional regulator YafY
LGDGWVAMRMNFENRDQARFMLLGLGARARVLAPLELRQAVAEEINVMLAQMNSETAVSRP